VLGGIVQHLFSVWLISPAQCPPDASQALCVHHPSCSMGHSFFPFEG